MNRKNKTLLLVGGLGVVGLLLYEKMASAGSTTGTQTSSGGVITYTDQYGAITRGVPSTWSTGYYSG